MKKDKCLVCKHIKHTELDEKGNQESICKLFNHYVSKDDLYKKVDCTNYVRIPYSCASCGYDVTSSCKKATTPLKTRGKNKDKPIECCKNPDFRYCPNKECENQDYSIIAKICMNCGYYYGFETW